jgi:hypothetical protein
MSELPIGKQVSLPGHFHVPVILGAARSLGKGLECRVRLPDGSLDEAVITTEGAAALAGAVLRRHIAASARKSRRRTRSTKFRSPRSVQCLRARRKQFLSVRFT